MREWKELLAEVRVAGPLPIAISWNENGAPLLGPERNAFAVYLDLTSVDVHDGRRVVISRSFMPWSWPGRDAAIQRIHEECRLLYEHELGEFFHVGSERPMDPHAGDVR